MTTRPTLVTGATGFVGSHLLDLLADDAPVVAWYRPGGRPPDATRPIDWQAVDLVDADGVRAAIEDATPSRIFHLAGESAVDRSYRSVVPHLRANALGTHYLLEAVRHATWPCRVLVVTSAQVYQIGDDPIDESAPLIPRTPYGFSKLAQDQLALRAATEDGLDVVVARPFNHIGPRQQPGFAVSSFARQIARIEAGLEPAVLRVGNLDARRDVTDVRDVVEAYHVLMAGAPVGRPYNICSGRAWRMGDLLEELVQLARVRVELEVDADRLRPSDIPVVQGDASRLRTEFGWAPRIPVEQTLADTLDWWRDEVRSGR
ncbi:MAG: GDP-mannose 4,6-dehydratase [Vicinamibacterales bacterium]